MSLTDARRESAAMRATFSDALDEAADACNNVASVLRRGATAEVNVEDLSRLLGGLISALGTTRDATLTWAAMDTMLREVER